MIFLLVITYYPQDYIIDKLLKIILKIILKIMINTLSFFNNSINEICNIFLIDFSYLLYNYFSKINCSNTKRWFLLHSIVNMIVVYYSVKDVQTCIVNISTCYSIPWNNNSIKVYNYAFMLHIYHCIFFKLTINDYLHHFFMVAICGTMCFKLKSILSSFSLFFLSGLPGGIDYFLLYLVKNNQINTITEKKIYIYLSAYIRSPGCIFTFLIGMNGVVTYYNNKNYYKCILILSTIVLIFLNGQYYLMKSHETYFKKRMLSH